MNVEFFPEVENQEQNTSVGNYQEIWSSRGKEIIASIEYHFGMALPDITIKCCVGVFPSHSGNSFGKPMKLRSTYGKEQKIGFLIHELCHRLIENISKGKLYSDEHYILYPGFYFVLNEVLGQHCAKKHIEFERSLSSRYDFCWQRTLSHDVKCLANISKRDLVILKKWRLNYDSHTVC